MSSSRRVFLGSSTIIAFLAAVAPKSAFALAGKAAKQLSENEQDRAGAERCPPLIGQCPQGWIVEVDGRRQVIPDQAGLTPVVQVGRRWYHVDLIDKDGLVWFNAGDERNAKCAWVNQQDARLEMSALVM